MKKWIVVLTLSFMLAGCQKVQEAEVVTDYTSTDVPTTDRITFHCWWSDSNGVNGTSDTKSQNVFYAYIEDGDLYYCFEYAMQFMTYSDKNWKEDRMQRYTGLSDIRRLKTYNRGSDVNPVPCLITEEGDVYWVRYGSDIDGLEVEKDSNLEGYQVEDILDYYGEWDSYYELLLKDGTIVTLEFESEYE